MPADLLLPFTCVWNVHVWHFTFPATLRLRLHGTSTIPPAWFNWRILAGFLGAITKHYLSLASIVCFPTLSDQSGCWRHNKRKHISWSYKRLFINQTSEHTTTRGTIQFVRLNVKNVPQYRRQVYLCYLWFSVVVLVDHISTLGS